MMGIDSVQANQVAKELEESRVADIRMVNPVPFSDAYGYPSWHVDVDSVFPEIDRFREPESEEEEM